VKKDIHEEIRSRVFFILNWSYLFELEIRNVNILLCFLTSSSVLVMEVSLVVVVVVIIIE
jgi:hypothetical protein